MVEDVVSRGCLVAPRSRSSAWTLFLAMLTKPEELVGMLSKPGEFVASAYDFAERLLSSQRKFAEGMVEPTKPRVGDPEGAAADKDDAE